MEYYARDHLTWRGRLVYDCALQKLSDAQISNFLYIDVSSYLQMDNKSTDWIEFNIFIPP